MRVCTIFTGGTIGSILKDDGYIGVGNSDVYRLISLYKNKYNAENIEFVTEEPYRILSENLKGKYLELLIESIKKALCENDFDGIIITHGTDTLQYTAAVLEYVFAESGIPIVLVSSDYVLEDDRANGLINFHVALEFIKKGGKGVFVSYCNKGDIPVVHRGTHLQNALLYSADVSSILDSWYAKYTECGFEYNNLYNSNDTVSLIKDTDNIKLKDNLREILYVRVMPGCAYPEINESVKVVLLEGFHSGTIRIDEDFIAFANKAQKLGIRIFLTGLVSGEAEYETVEEYKKYKVTPLFNKTTISQYCKLWLILSNDLELSELMNKNFGEEFCQ